MGLKRWLRSTFNTFNSNEDNHVDTVEVVPVNPKPKKYIPPTKDEQRALMKMCDEEAYKFIMDKLPEYVKLDDSTGISNWWRKSGVGLLAYRPDLKYGYDYIKLVDLFQYPNVELWGVIAFLGHFNLKENKLRGFNFTNWRKEWEKKLNE